MCSLTKSHPRRKKGVATQISSDQENERTFQVVQNEQEFEERNKEIMEFIEESKEASSQSIVPMKDSIVMRSTSNISCISDLMHKSKGLTNYPLK